MQPLEAEGTSPEREAAREIALLAKRAVANDRPLFLLAFCQNESDVRAVLTSLRATAHVAGVAIDVISPDDDDIGRAYDQLARSSEAGRLAVLRELPRDAADPTRPSASFLSYLNLHRDRIASDRLRFLLILRTREAETFIARAPDLWDFRHGTYWIEREASVLLGTRFLEPIARMEAGAASPPTDAARAEVRKRLERVTKLLTETEEATARAALRLDLAQWLAPRGFSLEAAAACREALEDLPDEEVVLRARIEVLLGDLHVALGNGTEAKRLFERSLEIAERLANQEPGRADFQRDLAVSYERIGDITEAPEAEHWLDRAVAIRRRLHALDAASAVLQRELAIALDLRGRTCHRPEDRGEARFLLRALNDRGALEVRYRALLEELESLALPTPGASAQP